jgi:hypothetical protein
MDGVGEVVANKSKSAGIQFSLVLLKLMSKYVCSCLFIPFNCSNNLCILNVIILLIYKYKHGCS